MNNASIATGGEFYKLFPESCAPDDYWRQVGRTVNGKPVSEAQIGMIVDAVNAGLELGKEDRLLDLCCGNGALTRYFLSRCRGGVGIDFSPSLIKIARRDFLHRTSESYELMDAVDYVQHTTHPSVSPSHSATAPFSIYPPLQPLSYSQPCDNDFPASLIFTSETCPTRH